MKANQSKSIEQLAAELQLDDVTTSSKVRARIPTAELEMLESILHQQRTEASEHSMKRKDKVLETIPAPECEKESLQLADLDSLEVNLLLDGTNSKAVRGEEANQHANKSESRRKGPTGGGLKEWLMEDPSDRDNYSTSEQSETSDIRTGQAPASLDGSQHSSTATSPSSKPRSKPVKFGL